MNKISFVLFVLFILLLSLLAASSGRIEDNPNGYVVTLPDGTEKFLDYPYCAPIIKQNLFVKCGHWSSDNNLTAVFVKEYEAQITSFSKK